MKNDFIHILFAMAFFSLSKRAVYLFNVKSIVDRASRNISIAFFLLLFLSSRFYDSAQKWDIRNLFWMARLRLR